MKNISDKAKAFYLVVLILFISTFGLFWLDYIGMINMGKYLTVFKSGPPSVVTVEGDEPSLIALEEFEKEKENLRERIEGLDKREALLAEREKEIEAEKEKLEEVKKGLELEQKKFVSEKKKYSGYHVNVKKLAGKISNMPPEESVKIMIKWEEPLIIDVLRQMDADALEAGRASITAYLITLMPKDKASRIMYLMTQL